MGDPQGVEPRGGPREDGERDEHGRRRPQWGEPFWHPVLRRTVATTEGRRFVGVDGAELVDGGRAGDEAGSYDEG